MTVAPDVAPLAFTDMDGAIAGGLRERGLRLSTSRRLVLEALFAADGPVSAEHLAAGLHVEVASVYRNLETLESNGIVRHVHLGHGPGLYGLLAGGEHEYLFCERCGAVRSVPPDELEPIRERVREQFGYEARFTHFPIVGVCAACAGAGRDVKGSAGEHSHEHSHGDYVHSHSHGHGAAEHSHRH